MRLNDALQYAFDHVRDGVHRTVDGLNAEQLAWRPAPDANTIAWLVWHLTRVVDVHVAEIAGEQTVVLELRVARDDLGKVIGKQGRTVKAMRALLSAASAKLRKRADLEILE